MTPAARKALIVLTADDNAESALLGLFSRCEAMGISQVSPDIFVHPHRDPGCCLEAVDFLRNFAGSYEHALVMFDHQGCGRENQPPSALEQHLEQRLSRSGWEDRAEAIVIEPELDVWVWSDSPHVDAALGWRETQPKLRAWLQQAGYLRGGEAKPGRPKEALEKALRMARQPRSSMLYRRLAEKVSFRRCQDPAFVKLKNVLRRWFGPTGPAAV